MAKKKEIQQSVPLVAVDLGSGGVRAMAAEMNQDGLLHVLGVETSNKFECVERGIVTNSSDAGFMIGEVLRKLSNRVGAEALPSAFVCVGGRTMQLVSVPCHRDQVRKKEIERHLLDEMEAECKYKVETKYPNAAVLDVIPYYFTLDGKDQDHEPTPDQKAMILDGNYIVFVGKKELEQKVVDSFNRSAKRLERMYVRPDALMNAIATDEEMRQGCAILDLGAQTTTLTVYKGNQYLSNKVVPMGGYDITRDIEQIGISVAYAEQLKCKYGMASPELVTSNHRFRIPAPTIPGGEVAVMATDLAEIIASRLDQILTPLLESLNQEASRYKMLYVTGGGAMLQGIVEYLQARTSIPVEYGSHAAWLAGDTSDEMYMPTYSALVGTLLLGASYRDAHPVVQSNNKGRLIDEIKKTIAEETLRIFSDQNY